MINLRNALWIEFRKALRSNMKWYLLGGTLLVPAITALFMVILRDPEFARQLGLISAKAQLIGGNVDWPGYFKLVSQLMAVGGIFLFGFMAAWIFGREFEHGTVLDLLAVPVPRWAIILAKFVLLAVWGLLMTGIILGLVVPVGYWLDLPLWSPAAVSGGIQNVLVCTLLVLVLSSVAGLMASVGRGSLAGVAFMVLALITSQILSVMGWGEYFPWSVPALVSGAVEGLVPGLVSYWIVALTGLAGMLLTYVWWLQADQA